MRRLFLAAFAAGAAAFALTTSVGASTITSSLGVYVYPRGQQTESQQSQAESACYASAEQKTGIYPGTAPPPPSGGAVSGAARGAAGGAVIGAIAGNAGAGAGAGAFAGAVRGQRQQQAVAANQHAQRVDTLRRAFGACMDSKGYSVK